MKIVLAVGSKSHLFIAEALSSALLERGHKLYLLVERDYVNLSGVLTRIETHRLGYSIFRGLVASLDLKISKLKAKSILKNIKPDCVIGFGNEISLPTICAANQLNIKTIIHEQNSTLSDINIMLAPKVNYIAVSYSILLKNHEEFASKMVVTGNPVRSAIKAIRDVPYPELLEDGIMKILVLSGSKSANFFSNIVPNAILMLPLALRSRIRIDQQCEKEDLEMSRSEYLKAGISADLSTFFKDIPARLASSHLVISRSGSAIIAELITAGRPAILIPFPEEGVDYQRHNADIIEESNGGIVMPEEAFTPETLSHHIENFLNLPEKLAKMAENIKNIAITNAAEKIADLIEKA